jgi:hypothetical protein
MLLSYVFPERIVAADSYAITAYVNAARKLADKIMPTIDPSNGVEFSFQSITFPGTKEVAGARQAIENELRSRGLKFSKDSQPKTKLNITLSESFQQFIWIAEIRCGQKYDLVMTTQSRMPDAPAKGAAIQMTIQKKLIFEQVDPILDIKLFGDELLVLGPQQLDLYHRQNDRWELKNSSLYWKNPHPFPRDTRGQLFDSGDDIQVRRPGLLCSVRVMPTYSFNCSEVETPWTPDFGGIAPVLSKNYFVQENMPAFFSAAPIEDDGLELLAIAGIDGRTYLFDKSSNKTGTIDGWSSDIVTIDSGCGTRRQILATLPTDPLEQGVIQAFEIVHQKAIAVSSADELPGPITALWPKPSQKAAIAVSRDIKTGRYAAYYLSISCSR